MDFSYISGFRNLYISFSKENIFDCSASIPSSHRCMMSSTYEMNALPIDYCTLVSRDHRFLFEIISE